MTSSQFPSSSQFIEWDESDRSQPDQTDEAQDPDGSVLNGPSASSPVLLTQRDQTVGKTPRVAKTLNISSESDEDNTGPSQWKNRKKTGKGKQFWKSR